jgi:hypothetical protein
MLLLMLLGALDASLAYLLYCGRASSHSDARFRGPAPRRTYRYASGAEPRNLASEHESARPRYEAW